MMSKIQGPQPAQPISRVERSRQAARTAYDRLSGWYDLLAGSEQAFNRRALAMLEPRKGEGVIEIGFGTGHTLAALAGRGCRVAGVDLSLGMARAARARLRKKGYQANTLPCLGDGARLPYATGCFDVVFTAFTLELFDTPEIPVVLQEIWRVLRRGGRLGVVGLALPERPGRMVRVYEWFHRATARSRGLPPHPGDGICAAEWVSDQASGAKEHVGASGGNCGGRKSESLTETVVYYRGLYRSSKTGAMR